MLGLGIWGFVLRIMGFVAWDKWAQQLYYAYSQDPAIRDLKEGVEYIKWGVIATIIIGTLGHILFLVGWNKAYKSIAVLAQRPIGSPQSYRPPAPAYYQAPPGSNSSSPFSGATTGSPAPSYATVKPITNGKKIT